MNFEFIIHKIEAMEAQHENSIAVMSGAYFAAQEVHKDDPDFGAFLSFMDNMIQRARFFEWHESLPQACRTFCNLAMIDPKLVEADIGMTFEKHFSKEE